MFDAYPIMWKHDVIHKTGNTHCIALREENNRPTAIGYMYRKFREVWTRGLWDTRADRQTDKHTDTLIAILHTLSGKGWGWRSNYGMNVYSETLLEYHSYLDRGTEGVRGTLKLRDGSFFQRNIAMLFAVWKCCYIRSKQFSAEMFALSTRSMSCVFVYFILTSNYLQKKIRNFRYRTAQSFKNKPNLQVYRCHCLCLVSQHEPEPVN